MVEAARNAIVDPALPDPETGILAGVAELICAAEVRADNPAKTTTATKAVENDLISRLCLCQRIETEN